MNCLDFLLREKDNETRILRLTLQAPAFSLKCFKNLLAEVGDPPTSTQVLRGGSNRKCIPLAVCDLITAFCSQNNSPSFLLSPEDCQ